VDLYIHSPIRFHGSMLNSLSTGTTLPFYLSGITSEFRNLAMLWCVSVFMFYLRTGFSAPSSSINGFSPPNLKRDVTVDCYFISAAARNLSCIFLKVKLPYIISGPWIVSLLSLPPQNLRVCHAVISDSSQLKACGVGVKSSGISFTQSFVKIDVLFRRSLKEQ
jgi:hypothetical protein